MEVERFRGLGFRGQEVWGFRGEGFYNGLRLSLSLSLCLSLMVTLRVSLRLLVTRSSQVSIGVYGFWEIEGF